jgi:hypothetical protein
MNIAAISTINTRAPTPIPIPIFAPVDRASLPLCPSDVAEDKVEPTVAVVEDDDVVLEPVIVELEMLVVLLVALVEVDVDVDAAVILK